MLATPIGRDLYLGGRRFSPLDLLNVRFWSDASRIGGLADDATVPVWSNLGPPGGSATEATLPPTYKVAIQNGLPVVRWVAASTPRLAFPDTTNYQQFSIFALAIPRGGAGTGRAIVEKASAGNQRNLYLIINAANGLTIGFTSAVATYKERASTGTLTIGTPHICEGHFDGTTLTVALNGVEETSTPGAVPQNVGTSLGLGHLPVSLAEFMDGDEGELIVCSAHQTPALRLAARRYLGAKWGVAVG